MKVDHFELIDSIFKNDPLSLNNFYIYHLTLFLFTYTSAYMYIYLYGSVYIHVYIALHLEEKISAQVLNKESYLE